MTTLHERALILAREIADDLYPPQIIGLTCRENSMNFCAREAALAAILRTTELAAIHVNDHGIGSIAYKLRDGHHLKLKETPDAK